jgi:hypothetical protein
MSATLKFGNGQWATKVGSTLAFNDEGGNFKPLPFNFTRSTSATRVNKEGLIEVVPNNEPRIDFLNDSNGALLLESSRSNYVLKSDDVLTTYGSQNGDVSDASEPINGFNNSIQIEYDASSSLVYKRDFTPTIGTEYTISCFVQMNDNSAPIHTVDVNSGDFCLINNNTVVGASDIKTERLGSTNVYRVSATKTASDTNNRFGIIKYSTQSSKGFKVTGFQLEQGYQTSYIPTQGAISTRVAESCSDAGNNQVINSTEGVLYAEISALANDITQRAISLSDGTNTNRVTLLYNDASNAIRLFLQVGGATQASIITTAYTITDFHKIAVKWALNDFSLWVDGVEAGTDNLGIIFPSNTLSTLDFNFPIGGAAFYGNVKDVRVYNTALTDLQIQQLTTL